MINIIIISYYISNVKSSPDPISNIHTFSSATPARILVLAASDNEKENISGESKDKRIEASAMADTFTFSYFVLCLLWNSDILWSTIFYQNQVLIKTSFELVSPRSYFCLLRRPCISSFVIDHLYLVIYNRKVYLVYTPCASHSMHSKWSLAVKWHVLVISHFLGPPPYPPTQIKIVVWSTPRLR